MPRCPHCPYEEVWRYVDPEVVLRCPACGWTGPASCWLGPDGMPLGIPFADLPTPGDSHTRTPPQAP